MTHNNAITKASGFYLSTILPDDWYKFEDDELKQYVMSNRWKPYETEDFDFIMELITELAQSFVEISNGKY